MSKECKAPRKHRAHIHAAHTEVQHDPHDADDESNNVEQRSSLQEYEEDQPDLNKNKEYIKVEVNSYTQENSYYARESDMEFMSSMHNRAMEPEDMLTMMEANCPKKGWVRIRKAVMRASKTACACPITTKEEKECLTMFVDIGGFKAWALWDLGSTTTGITPTFLQVANIPVFPLLESHVLQLGTIGSRSIVNYRTEMEVMVPGAKGTIYMDIANFDRYDMIIGTPYMRRNKVQLDFENDQVIVNRVAMPATKVTPSRHRWMATSISNYG
jgi:hypothetical protein